MPQSGRQNKSWTGDAIPTPLQRTKFKWFPPPAWAFTTGQGDRTKMPDDVTAVAADKN